MKKEMTIEKPVCPWCGKPMAYNFNTPDGTIQFTCITVDCPIGRVGYMDAAQARKISVGTRYKQALQAIRTAAHCDLETSFVIADEALKAEEEG